MNSKRYFFVLLFLASSLTSMAQLPNLVGGNSTVFDNSDPCRISVEFEYTNDGLDHAGSFKNGLYLTDDLFTADPAWDILAAEASNGQGCLIGEFRTSFFTNIDISQLPGLNHGQTYYAYVFLDSGEQIDESDEDDNLYSVGNTNCNPVGIIRPAMVSKSVHLGPNPTQGAFRVDIDNPNQEPVNISVFAPNGQRVRHGNQAQAPAGGDQFFLNLEGQTPGLYTVRVMVGQEVSAHKVVLQ